MGWTPEYYERNRDRIAERSREYSRTPKARSARLQRAYGITLEQYDAMLAAQRNRCALCDAHCGEKKLDVDHCHQTGRVRGLLCRQCNLSLGRLGDSPEAFRRVLSYLEASPLGAVLASDLCLSAGPGPGVVAGQRTPGREV